LKLLLTGFLQKQVAFELGISESRVQDVKSNIKRKWGVCSDIDFIVTAIRKGYLKIEQEDVKTQDSPHSFHCPESVGYQYTYEPSKKQNVRIIIE